MIVSVSLVQRQIVQRQDFHLMRFRGRKEGQAVQIYRASDEFLADGFESAPLFTPCPNARATGMIVRADFYDTYAAQSNS